MNRSFELSMLISFATDFMKSIFLEFGATFLRSLCILEETLILLSLTSRQRKNSNISFSTYES